MKKNRKKIINLALAYTVIAGGAAVTVGCDKEPGFSIVWSDSIDETLSLQPGESLMLFAKRDDEKIGTITYAITEGGEYATISTSGVLTISKMAPVDQKIKVQAISGKVKSSEIEITVMAVKEIVLTSNVTSNIVNKGAEITLNTNYKNSTDSVSDVTYKIKEGSQFATITNNVLKINDNAPAYSVITVISESQITTSNTVTFIVAEETPQFDLDWDESMGENAELQPGESLLLLAKRSDNEVVAINYVITAGSEYATITTGGVLQISKNAPADQIVKVKANCEGVESSEFTITVIEKSDIVLSSNASTNTVNREEEITLSATYKDTTNAVEGVTYRILQGSEYASIVGNVLTINEDVPDFAMITVIAETELTQSGTITFIVAQAAPQFQVVWGSGVTDKSLQPGESTILVASRNDNVPSTITYMITLGSEYASVSTTGVLTIAKTATVGQTVKVKAVCDGVESSEITLTIIAVKEITLTSNAASNTVEREDEITLSATYKDTVIPVNNVTYRITEGSAYATIVDNKLKIRSDAANDKTITVIAESPITTSNTLTFTVYVPAVRDKYFVYSNESNITIDATSDGASKSITVQTINMDTSSSENIQPSDYVYEVIEGQEYVSVDSDGVVTSVGHGVAKIKVTYESNDPLIKDASTTITVNSILPPETIELSEMLTKQASKEVSYLGFGLKDQDDRSFNLGIVGTHTTATHFADTYKVNIYVDGATTPSTGYATFDDETGELTFDVSAIGHELRVEVLSDTGANREARAEFTININDGYNIYDMEDLMNHKTGTNVTINLLGNCVLEGNSNTVGNNAGISSYVLTYYGHTSIYGNGFDIDFSNVINNYSGGKKSDLNLIDIKNDNGTGAVLNENINVKIYDLNLRGNNGFNKEYQGENSDAKVSPTNGAHDIAINIEGASQDRVLEYLKDKVANPKPYIAYVDMNNINIHGFETGIRVQYANSKAATEFTEAKTSKISNVIIDNCLESGIQTVASILTFENIKLGRFGTTGIETTPDVWWTAGEDFEQAQTITFKGSYDSNNHNALNNSYAMNELGGLGTGIIAEIAKLGEKFNGVNIHSFVIEYINEKGKTANGLNLVALVFNNPEAFEKASQGRDLEKLREFLNGTVIKFEDLNGEAVDIVEKITAISTALGSGNQEEVRQHLIDLYSARFIRLDAPAGSKVEQGHLDGLNLLPIDQATKDYLLANLHAGDDVTYGGIIVANPLYNLVDKDGNINVGGNVKALQDLTFEELVALMQIQEVVLGQ